MSQCMQSSWPQALGKKKSFPAFACRDSSSRKQMYDQSASSHMMRTNVLMKVRSKASEDSECNEPPECMST